MTEFEWYGCNSEIWFRCKLCDAQWQATDHEEPVSIVELARVQAEHAAEVHSPLGEALDAFDRQYGNRGGTEDERRNQPHG